MAKKNVSAIISGAGLVAGVWKDLDRAVRKAGGSDEDLHRLATPDGEEILAKIAEIIVMAGRPKPSLQTFTLKVDLSKTLKELIELGNYDWVNEDITQETLPIEKGKGTEEVEVVLVCFREFVTTDEAKSRIAKLGLEPSGIQELLTLGAAEPELQRQFPIAALGSSWRDPGGRLYSPFLCEHDGRRHLSLRWYYHEDQWHEDYRFLCRHLPTPRLRPADRSSNEVRA